MRRIYFLVPTVASARAIVDDLLLARIEERHLHVVAKEDTPLQDLPEAGVAQKSDLVPALQRGVAAGGLAGLLAGVLAVTFPPAGLVLGGGALLGMAAFGAGFSAWMSSMVGSLDRHHRLGDPPALWRLNHERTHRHRAPCAYRGAR